MHARRYGTCTAYTAHAVAQMLMRRLATLEADNYHEGGDAADADDEWVDEEVCLLQLSPMIYGLQSTPKPSAAKRKRGSGSSKYADSLSVLCIVR